MNTSNQRTVAQTKSRPRNESKSNSLFIQQPAEGATTPQNENWKQLLRVSVFSLMQNFHSLIADVDELDEPILPSRRDNPNIPCFSERSPTHHSCHNFKQQPPPQKNELLFRRSPLALEGAWGRCGRIITVLLIAGEGLLGCGLGVRCLLCWWRAYLKQQDKQHVISLEHTTAIHNDSIWSMSVYLTNNTWNRLTVSIVTVGGYLINSKDFSDLLTFFGKHFTFIIANYWFFFSPLNFYFPWEIFNIH